MIHGRPAQRLAQAFETAVGSKRQALLRNVVLGWLPWADVRQVSLLSDEGAWQLKLEADVTLVGFARPEGRDGKIWALPGIAVVHRVYPGPRATSLGARYASQADRTTALAIDEPLLYHVKRRIELPPNTAVTHLAKPLDVAGLQLTADRTVSQQAGVITESQVEAIRTRIRADLEQELAAGKSASNNCPSNVISANGIDGRWWRMPSLGIAARWPTEVSK